MNKVILSGRITKEVELRYTKGGTAFTNIDIAVDKGLSKERKAEFEAMGKPTADFPRIVLFGGQAEFISKFADKGSRVIVEGTLQTGSYKNEQGHTVYTTDVLADNIELIDWKEVKQVRPQQEQYRRY